MLHVRLCPCDSPMSEIELKNALAVGKENEIVAFVQPPKFAETKPSVSPCVFRGRHQAIV